MNLSYKTYIQNAMDSEPSIRYIFIMIIFLIFSIIGLTLLILNNNKILVNKETNRYESYLLAQELRQSSDDLTRLVRTYVVTGDENYKRMFWDVLGIRNGELPRPTNYDKIYWDLIIDYDRDRKLEGVTRSLKNRMVDMGFTQEEFNKLKESQSYSDNLVLLEEKAMDMVQKNQGIAKAIQLMHNRDYHNHKYKIMSPLNEFFDLVDKRTKIDIARTIYLGNLYIYSMIILFTILSVIIYFTLMILFRGKIDAKIYFELNERIKELKCIKGISEILMNNYSLSHQLRECVKILPSGWMHPEKISACIYFGRESYNTDPFLESTHFQESIRFLLNGDELRIKIFYPDEPKGFYKFLNEEFQLIHSLTNLIYLRIENVFEHQNLIIAKSKAEESSKAKSDFLANMSHELRTPLNGVIGFTELLSSTPLSKVQEEYAHNANISGRALLNIVNDILDLSKIEANKMDLELVVGDIISTAEEAIDILKFAANLKGLEILLNIQLGIPRFCILDSNRLGQVLINLLSNAVKFTHEGEVELKLQFEKITSNKGIYHFSIRDTGIGIHESNKDKLFKAFSQGDSSTTRKFGGTGLGLIISQLLVEKMGGSIKFNSIFEKGSTFYFSIETEYIDERISDKSENSLSELKILIVDDNPNNRIILSDILSYWNIPHTLATNGMEALDVLSNESYDIAVIDYHMPKMDGLETIYKIRKELNLSGEELKIYLLHNSSFSFNIDKAMEDYCIQYNLIKPLKYGELYSCLTESRLNYNHSHNTHNSMNELRIYPQLVSSYNTTKNSISTDDSISNNHKIENEFTILIAEDVVLNMVFLKKLLLQIRPDLKILEAGNGIQALHILQKNHVDLVFMDFQMPEMDGLEATKAIRSGKISDKKDIPIIALTAGGTLEDRKKAQEVGMNDFLAKPLVKSQLSRVLEVYAPISG